MKEIRIGVIGVGGRGELAEHAHNPAEGVYLWAGADINKDALARFKERYGSDTFITTDYKELLTRPEINAIFIASPDYLHEEHAVAALEAGKDIFLEKPMAITITGCDRILKAAMDNKCKLYLGHNMRHMIVIQKMKEMIDQGYIGEVKGAWCRHYVSYGGDSYFKDWHADRSKTTGLLIHKGTHDIDVLHWLCGAYTRRVTAMGGLTVYGDITDRAEPEKFGDDTHRFENWPPLTQKKLYYITDVEDLSMMLMELDNGVFASYQQCHYTPDAWRNYMIIGTEGRLENFGDEPGSCVIRVWNKRCIYNAEGDIEIAIPPVEGSHGGADPQIVAEFVRYLQHGRRIATSPVAARYSVAAGYMATESLRNGNVPMEVPALDDEVVKYYEMV